MTLLGSLQQKATEHANSIDNQGSYMKNEEFKGLLGMGLWPVRKKGLQTS